MNVNMLYLAKILPVFVLPVGFAIILLIASIVFRKRTPTVVALVLLWFSSTPLVGDAVMRVAEGWQVRRPVADAPAADAVVVLSGMLSGAPGKAAVDEWTDGVDRFEAGVELVKAGKAPVLIFTGGWLPWRPNARPEGEVLRERAAALGVPRDRILVTAIVRNTAEEASAVAQLLRGQGQAPGPRSIVLVTSAYHMRRSRLLFTRAGLSVTPFPVDFQASASPLSFIGLLPQAESIRNTELAVRELYGYLYYTLIKTK